MERKEFISPTSGFRVIANTHLIVSNIFGSETFMFLARFQLRCPMGTIDL